MTEQLREKSDVYSFGVLLLEVVTLRKQLERVRYIVRVMKATNIRLVPTSGTHPIQHRPIAPPLLTCSTRHHHLEQD